MNLELKQINNFKVKPVEGSAEIERKKQKGKKLFSLWCPSIYEIAKTGTGKTTVAINICNQVGGKYTKYILIVSTVNIDPSWKAFVEKLGDRCVTYTDIKDEDGTNIIEQFMKDQDPENYGNNEDDEYDNPKIGAGSDPYAGVPLNNFKRYQLQVQPIKQPIKGGSKREDEDTWNYPYPKYIIIMDDLGNSMRNKWVTELLKRNRHYNTLVIASSQDYNDLDKPARKQPRYVLVFRGMSQDKLKELHKDLDLPIDFETFTNMYKKATDEKYSFLYIGRLPAGVEYRKNFNKKFNI